MATKMARVVTALGIPIFLLGGCAGQPLAERARLRNSVNKQAIAAHLKEQRRLFDGCGEAYGGSGLSGTLTVRFKIRSNGSTSNPHVLETIGQSAALDHCLTDAALQLVFDPMPKGVVANIKYPLQFQAVRGPASVPNEKALSAEPAHDALPE